jgi:uncharacterized repeat protein (TIGR01451 family)
MEAEVSGTSACGQSPEYLKRKEFAMTRAKIVTAAGMVHLAVAIMFVLMILFGRPALVSSAMLGFTPTNPPPPTDTPVPSDTPSDTPSGTPVPPPQPTPAPEPVLTITKSASPTEVFPGGQVVFSIRVCNVGEATAASVIVSDALPGEMDLVSAWASQGKVVVEGNAVRAELGALEVGECASVTIVARVRDDVAPGTEIRNVASVGDIWDDAIVVVLGLLPESGRLSSLLALAGLLVVGVGLLVVGTVLRTRRQS